MHYLYSNKGGTLQQTTFCLCFRSLPGIAKESPSHEEGHVRRAQAQEGSQERDPEARTDSEATEGTRQKETKEYEKRWKEKRRWKKEINYAFWPCSVREWRANYRFVVGCMI